VLAPELFVVASEVVEVCSRMASMRECESEVAPSRGVLDGSGVAEREMMCCRCRRRDWNVWRVIMPKTKQSQRGRMTGMRKMSSWPSARGAWEYGIGDPRR